MYPLTLQDLDYPENVYEMKATTSVCKPSTINKFSSDFISDSPRKTAYVHQERLPNCLIPEKMKEKEFIEDLSSSICPIVSDISIPNNPAISNEGEESLTAKPLVPQGLVKGKEKEYVQDLSSSSTCPIDFAISKISELTLDSVNIKEEVETYSPIYDSGLEIETKLSVIDTEDEYHDLHEECRLDSSRIKIIQ